VLSSKFDCLFLKYYLTILSFYYLCKYLDLSGNGGTPTDFIISSTGVWYWADNTNAALKYYQCTGTTLASCSDLGFTVTNYAGKMALDSTETIMYFADGDTIQKCTIKSGSCSTYLASTTVIGKDLANQDLTPDLYDGRSSSIAVDARYESNKNNNNTK